MATEFGDHLHEIQRHRWLVVSLAVLAGLVVWALLATRPTRFESETVVQLEVESPDQLVDDGSITEFRTRTYAELATTPLIVDRAIVRSGLDLSLEDALDRLVVELRDNAGFVEIAATGPDEVDAVALADAVARELVAFAAAERGRPETVSIRVVSAADQDVRRVGRPALAGGALAGLVVGLLTAEAVVGLRLLRGRLSPVNPAGDVERQLGLPSLSIDAHATLVPFYLEHLSSHSELWIVSRGGDEHATTTAIADVAAAFHRNVLVVDGDMREPTLHQVSGLSRSPGLSDASTDQQDLRTLIRRPPEGGRWAVTTAGTPGTIDAIDHQTALHRLAEHAGADQMIVSLTNRATTDDAVIAAVSQGRSRKIVLVLDHEESSRSALRRSVANLGRGGGEVVGILFTAGRAVERRRAPVG